MVGTEMALVYEKLGYVAVWVLAYEFAAKITPFQANCLMKKDRFKACSPSNLPLFGINQ